MLNVVMLSVDIVSAIMLSVIMVKGGSLVS
jgi:hypothetical protein